MIRPRRSSPFPAEWADPVRRDGGTLPDAIDWHDDVDPIDHLAPYALRELADLRLLVEPGDTLATLSARVGTCPVAMAGVLLKRGCKDVLEQLQANDVRGAR